jgi:outer membrane protein assembly factor BamB
MKNLSAGTLIPGVLAVAGVAALVLWAGVGPARPLEVRVPGLDRPKLTGEKTDIRPLVGKLTRGNGVALNSAGKKGTVPICRNGPEGASHKWGLSPFSLPGSWPRFRGERFDGIGEPGVPLARQWPATGPPVLWSIELGEGHAGAAVRDGRVFVLDYDRPAAADAVRCLSLADGREIWRFSYPVNVKRNHGMSRTVPAVSDKYLVALGPKCHVSCLDPATGKAYWLVDLVRQFGATVPPWYAGQCPLIDHGAVILAPGGKNALLLALEGQTGKVLWQTPNPHGWKMTHSSVMPLEFGGERMYVYCANKGVVGVSARDGSLLWETPDWKISIATVPSPLILDGGRIFLTGGYDAGSLMLQLGREGGRFVPRTVFKLAAGVFGATQHTPILHENHLYGVRADGKFVCLTLEGQPVWTSPSGQQFGLGSFIMADGLIFAMNDAGLLRLLEATPDKYALLAQAQVLKGQQSWGPLALAGGRLIARDLTRMVCLDVARP